MEAFSAYVIFNLSVVGLAFTASEINPKQYDDLTLKGCLAAMLVLSIVVIGWLQKKRDADKDKHTADLQKQNETVVNAVTETKNALTQLTQSIDKLNYYMDTFAKEAVGGVFEAGIVKYSKHERDR